MRVERLSSGPEIIPGLRLARVAPTETLRAIEALRKRADVIYAEPNYIRRKTNAPNDPRYPQMWGLNNIGQSTTSGGNPGKVGNDVRAEQAWNVTSGSRSVVVGVVDEGIDVNHEDLRDNVWTNPGEVAGNGVDDDGNGLVDDINGWDFAHNDGSVFDYTAPSYPPAQDYSGDVDDHGTHVAGTIGATGNNGIGVVGVNWQVSLMSLKFLTGEGEGTSVDLLKALGYAKSMRELWTSSGGTKGANLRVLNNSYGGDGSSQAELEAIRALGAAGILFVVAAGNEGLNNDMFPVYPSSYISTNLISVAASSGGGIRASFSNSGPATVHLAAPGQHILSTTPRNTYNFFSGTSNAATFNSPTVYVDALLQTVGLPGHPSRTGWIATLDSNNNVQTRAQVLRQLVESAEVYNKYYNEAFVIMQYFGYLRRTADASYLNWIQTMNQTSGDYRTMINGFMNSSEYRRRFGP
ncbi:MAG: S8 family peptidase [Acidobacteriota bacterium]